MMAEKAILAKFLWECKFCYESPDTAVCTLCNKAVCSADDCEERHRTEHRHAAERLHEYSRVNPVSYSKLAERLDEPAPPMEEAPTPPSPGLLTHIPAAIGRLLSPAPAPAPEGAPTPGDATPSPAEPAATPAETEAMPSETGQVLGSCVPTPTYELLPAEERLRRHGAGVKPVGLQNLSTTCYMNSALQVLFAADILRAFYSTNAWEPQVDRVGMFSTHGRISQAFATLIQDSEEKRLKRRAANQGEMERPTRYGSSHLNMYEFFRTFAQENCLYENPHEQHDSQEFLSHLLDKLHEDVNRAPCDEDGRRAPNDLSAGKTSESIMEVAQRFDRQFKIRDESLVEDLFRGLYMNSVTCGACNFKSVTFDRYFLLPLAIPQQLVRKIRVILFPLPRGSPPMIVEIGLQHGASTLDLSDKCAKILHTKKELIILVHQDVKSSKRDSGAYSVLKTQHGESRWSAIKNLAGDVTHLPATILAYEDRLPHTGMAYIHPADAGYPVPGEEHRKHMMLYPFIGATPTTSPYWEYTAYNDLKYNEKISNGGNYHSIDSHPVIVELGPVTQELPTYPLVFRVPIEALMKDVRALVLDALQRTIAANAYGSAPAPEERIPRRTILNQISNQEGDTNKYLNFFIGKNLERVEEQLGARGREKYFEQMGKLWSMAGIGLGPGELQGVDPYFSRPFQAHIDEEAAAAQAWRLRQMKRDEDALPPTGECSEERWAVEKELCEAFEITGPGPRRDELNLETPAEGNPYYMKPSDYAWFCNTASTSKHHLTYNEMPNEDEDQVVMHTALAARLRRRGYQTPFEYGDAPGRYQGPSPWDAALVDGHVTGTGITTFIDRCAAIASEKAGPASLEMGPEQFFDPEREEQKALTEDNSQKIEYYLYLNISDAGVSKFQGWMNDDPSLGGRISTYYDQCPANLKAIYHFKFRIGDILDTLDLQRAADETRTFPLTARMSEDQIKTFLEMRRPKALPICSVESIVTSNPRAFLDCQIPKIDHIDLKDLIKRDRASETLSGCSAVSCDNCKAKHTSLKQTTLYNTGEYLLVSLKRFSFMEASGNSRKSDLPFRFPGDGFVRLTDLLDGETEDEDCVMEVFGVVVHMGSLLSGHYISIVKGPTSPKGEPTWYKIDDEVVTSVSDRDARVLMENAYTIALRKTQYSPTFDSLPVPDSPMERFEPSDNDRPMEASIGLSTSSFPSSDEPATDLL